MLSCEILLLFLRLFEFFPELLDERVCVLVDITIEIVCLAIGVGVHVRGG